MEIQEHVPLAPYTTFGVGGPARWFAHANTEADVAEAVAWAEARDLPLFVLGGGSNLLVPDSGYTGVVLQVDLRGMAKDQPSFPQFWVGAGEPWDNLVDFAISTNCAGIECLAGIPGSTGGTPVQNVGAYGQEVAQTIQQVRVYDRERHEFRWLSHADCRFRYRESLFNTTARGRYIVTSVEFSLTPGGKPTLTYAELRERFAGKPEPTLGEVAAAVREIRQSKGMLLVDGDPDCRSAGSFFKNPVVSLEQAQGVAAAAGLRLEQMRHWPAGDGSMKLPAAWLLEHAGFVKGYGEGQVRISSKHTLALTNRGGAHYVDVLAFQQEIVAGVERKFGVRLEREPVTLE